MSLEGNKLQWVALFGVALGFAAVYLDQSALNIALPYIKKDLATSETQLFWIINAYLLTIAISCLAGGRIGDIIGIYTSLKVGLILFGAASLGCALAFSGPFFIIARVFQGVGGAMLMSVSSAAIFHIFPHRRRGRAMGFFGMSVVFFAMLGPVVGGLFTQYASWRWIFWINPMTGVVSFFILRFSIKELDKEKDPDAKFDYIGQFLFTIKLVALVIALMQGQSWGWGSPIIISLFCSAAVIGTIFYFVEKEKTSPLIDFKLFKNANFSVASFAFFCMQFGAIANVFFALYLERSLQLRPAIAGLGLLASTVPALFVSPFSGYLTDKYGHRKTIQVGLAMSVISYLWLVLTIHTLSYVLFAIGLVFSSFGLSTAMVANYGLMMHATPKIKQGMAGGIGMTMRQVGGSFGMAIMGMFIILFEGKYQKVLGLPEAYARGFTACVGLVGLLMAAALLSSVRINKDKFIVEV